MLCGDGFSGVVCVVDGGVSGDKGCGNVKWLILSCLGVLLTDWMTDEWTDIGRVTFATQNKVLVWKVAWFYLTE